MKPPLSFARQYGVRIVALAAILIFYGMARLPRLGGDERRALAARFAFERSDVAQPPGKRESVRTVHPSLERVQSWISSVGAAAALADLDGDGLPNDLCSIDNGTNSVVVTPTPGSGDCYPTFVLAAPTNGYNPALTAPMGCLPGDLNEDGAADLLVTYWGRPPLAFLRRAGAALPAPAAYRAQEIVSDHEAWYTNAATRADFDGDGHVDLVIGNYFPDGARILDPRGTGREDMQGSMSRAKNGGRNRLLRWVAATAGAEPTVELVVVPGVFDERAELGWTLALGAADLDGDLLPELYIGNDFGPDRLLHNRSRPGEVSFVPLFGQKGFFTPASKVLGHDSFKGMGIDFGDVNGDGRLDFFVSNIATEYALQESHFVWTSTGELERMRDGVAPYVDSSEPLGLSRSGWGWDSRLADFDNDGVLEAIQATGFVKGTVNRWPELHEIAMGNDHLLHHPAAWCQLRPGDDLSGSQHNPFFVRSQSGRYFDLAAEIGLGQPMVSRALAVGDVDGDADLDFAVGNQWERSFFYENRAPAAGAALLIELLKRGVSGKATPAIGATAQVRLPDGRRLVAEIDGGSGHSGKRAPELHFGLGRLDPATSVPVEVRWRDGQGRVHHHTFELRPGRHRLVLDDVFGNTTQGKENDHVG